MKTTEKGKIWFLEDITMAEVNNEIKILKTAKVQFWDNLNLELL
jgi:hypothetical protein